MGNEGGAQLCEQITWQEIKMLMIHDHSYVRHKNKRIEDPFEKGLVH
jgi:hypothetical protein